MSATEIMVWEVTAEFPQGHLRPMTNAELAQHEADQQAGAAATQQQATSDANAGTIRQRATDAIANLESAYTNWGTLTAAQKDAALRLNVRVTVGLVRLYLRLLDTPGV